MVAMSCLPCCVMDIVVLSANGRLTWQNGQELLRVLEGLKCEYILCVHVVVFLGSWDVSLHSDIKPFQYSKRKREARQTRKIM